MPPLPRGPVADISVYQELACLLVSHGVFDDPAVIDVRALRVHELGLTVCADRSGGTTTTLVHGMACNHQTPLQVRASNDTMHLSALMICYSALLEYTMDSGPHVPWCAPCDRSKNVPYAHLISLIRFRTSSPTKFWSSAATAS
jgi:hypothetical protein